jgi:ubiquinone/menaquinone biosynthesis C-methylase UbiE
MADTSECRVYELIAAKGVADGVIRPGGIPLTERALSLCAFPPGSRLLDIGCGAGVTVEYLIERHGFLAAGVDKSLAMLEQGRYEDTRRPLIRAAGESLPFASNQWDGVLVECSLSLTGQPDAVLRECMRVLSPKGKLILSDVYVRNAEAIQELRALSPHCCITGALTNQELLGKLKNCGFALLALEDHSSALKRFAAQLIFSGGSEGAFWCSLTGADALADKRIRYAVSNAKLGYYLAVAEKAVKVGIV